jgi:hypothetical protein
VEVTLPDKDHIAVGDVVRVIGAGGGWKIAQTGAQQVRLGSMVDASWTATGPHQTWWTVDSSADGKILVATGPGNIHISIDGGLTWTPQKNVPTGTDGTGQWNAVTISADGYAVTAAEWPGSIYAGTRSRIDGSWAWTKSWDGSADWASVDSSADGSTVMAISNGDAYTWNGNDANPQWAPAGFAGLSSVAVSGDGNTAIAVGDKAYIRKKVAGKWGPWESTNAPPNGGYSVALSGDGSTAVASTWSYGDYIYASINGGVTWEPRESRRDWYSVNSSADGRTLVAVEYNGGVYISIDGGATWAVVPGEPSRWWLAVTVSADGSTVVGVEDGGQIHIARNRTTLGKDGYISGGPLDSIELIYLGNDLYEVRSHEGRLTVR